MIERAPHLAALGPFYAQGLFLCLSSERCLKKAHDLSFEVMHDFARVGML